MKSRYIPILIVCGIFAAVAVGGQLMPAPSKANPIRLRFDNKGGDVVFTHQQHVDIGFECNECHHESDNPGEIPIACGDCHPVEFDAAYAKSHQVDLPQESCTRCHHMEFGTLTWDHQEHIDSYSTGCTDCHHGEDIEPEPMACSNCHGEEDDGATINLRDAVHVRCENCHSDMYEEKLAGCKHCHEQLPGKAGAEQPTCASCHYDAEGPLLPTRMDAFHGQCMDCHETSGAGPYGEDSCTQCHTR